MDDTYHIGYCTAKTAEQDLVKLSFTKVTKNGKIAPVIFKNNVEDIIAKLNKGETVDSIADSFTQALNKAIEIQKKKEVESIKNKKMKEILTLIFDYLKEFYPEAKELLVNFDLTDTAEIDIMVEEFDEYIKTFLDLMGLLQGKKSEESKDTNFSDVMDKFFTEFGL